MTGEASEIVMYATDWCPYCMRARRLLQSKGVTWREIDVDDSPDARAEMRSRTHRSTVPQIFIGDRHVGGFDDLNALDHAGALDALLSGIPRGSRDNQHAP